MENNLDKTYLELLKDILDNGNEKGDRTGTGTISVFGRQIRHKMSDGFPILTSKKLYFKGVVTELLWFLRGESNIQSLVKDDNNIWVGDAYKYYEKEINRLSDENPNISYLLLNKNQFIDKIKTDDNFAKEWGDMGPIYGVQWRDWNGIDQIFNLINDLKNNPDSRRMIVSAWHVDQIDDMKLPPCHYGFQVYTRELSEYEKQKWASDNLNKMYSENNEIPERAISLMWDQRSVDTPLGLPFNIASYGLLLEIIAKKVNMIPEELIGNLGDTHIYKDQLNGVYEQLKRKSHKLPKLIMGEKILETDIDKLKYDMFKFDDYQSEDKIYFPLSN